jgi:hypothetical protein
MHPHGNKCGCPCHKMPGIIMMIAGLSFLLKNGGVITEELNNWIWPSLIFVGGLTRMCKGMCKCCSKQGGQCQSKGENKPTV